MSTRTGVILFIAFAVVWILGLIAINGGFAGAGIIVPILLIIIIAASGLASIICRLILMFAAFRNDITTGLLFLFVPFYSLYFALTQYRDPNREMIIACWLGGSAVMAIVIFIFYYSLLSNMFIL
ncbi:MAG: hypothetical protein GX226_01460 [Dehalococcoidales bacterium]|nr:hypothetical protein [Dehalococcoidales bacterium]